MRTVLLRLVPLMLPFVKEFTSKVITKTGFSYRDVVVFVAGFSAAYLLGA